jgi:leucyl-tRNA synthetase
MVYYSNGFVLTVARVNVADIEGYGDTSAVTMAERLDIKSCKEADKLAKAKDEVYMKGFYEGVMLVGECKGMKVCDAKPIVRQSLIDAGHAFAYFEPEREVISRTGDECVVALCNQWYLAYGEEDWKQNVLSHVRDKTKFNMYNEKLVEQFELVINWLKEWACSRQFGLGTQLPWDEQWVIDSLSDSTVYMAYYTIAHHFHGDVNNASCFTGCDNNAVAADQFNDDAFDYIFLGKPLPSGSACSVPAEVLEKMRAEFEYWYPMDLRVSAKDLIQNHLTMALYNHAEIWKDRPEMMPKGYYCNGHIMVDAEKMSKSRGNFLMMKESIEEFTADGVRFALADAGDTLEDANFDRSVANNAMMYLFVEEEWVRSALADVEKGVLRTGSDMLFMDKAFDNEMDHLIAASAKCYDDMRFRDGIHRAWFDMVILRDAYRDWSQRCGIPMHRDVTLRYIKTIAVMMSPIVPHWSEVVWEALGDHRGENPSASVCNASWPSCVPCNKLISAQFGFFRDFLKNARQTRLKLKAKAGAPLPSGNVFLASTYEPNKVVMLEYLVSVYNADNNSFPSTFIADMKTFVDARSDFSPQDKKMMMQFGAFMKNEALDRGVNALDSVLDFDQKDILEENAAYIKDTLNLTAVAFYNIEAEESTLPGDKKKRDAAVPGKPVMLVA